MESKYTPEEITATLASWNKRLNEAYGRRNIAAHSDKLIGSIVRDCSDELTDLQKSGEMKTVQQFSDWMREKLKAKKDGDESLTPGERTFFMRIDQCQNLDKALILAYGYMQSATGNGTYGSRRLYETDQDVIDSVEASDKYYETARNVPSVYLAGALALTLTSFMQNDPLKTDYDKIYKAIDKIAKTYTELKDFCSALRVKIDADKKAIDKQI